MWTFRQAAAPDGDHGEWAARGDSRKSRNGRGGDSIIIFLVDDEAGVLKALTRLLRVEGYEVRAFETGLTFLAEHDPAAPGCAIVDITLPDCTGLEIQERLAREGVQRPIVFLTGTGDVASSVQAMKAGAVDFMTKPVQRMALLTAVRRAVDLDARIRQDREDRAVVDRLLATLSLREREVLMHVIAGRRNKQIAGVLGIGEKTVKVHRVRVMTKLGVRSVAELVRLLARADLLPGFERGGSPVSPPGAAMAGRCAELRQSVLTPPIGPRSNRFRHARRVASAP